MRKTFWLAALLLLTLGVARAQKQTWNLSKDVRAANSEVSFHQGSNQVWYFMESASLEHNPQIYSFLTDYSAPCMGNPADVMIDGIACWRDPTHTYDHAPLVSLNFTNQTQYPLTFAFPPHTVLMHPAPDRYAIVAWKSPIHGSVKVSGAFTDLDAACGNGILWSIDKGDRSLVTGDLPNGGSQSFALPCVRVAEGEVLYFVVDPKNGDYTCDATKLDLVISEIE